MACSHCGSVKVLAKGLCSSCYHRLWKTGDVTRKTTRNEGLCQHPGCTKLPLAKGLCQTHYNRADHPLKSVWKLLRSRHAGNYPAEWDDFSVFVKQVGNRPVDGAQLRRRDGDKPWSVENVHWLTPVIPVEDRVAGMDRKEYERAWRLRKKFKITPEREKETLAAQDGKCAICKSDVSHRLKDGREGRFHIDHDHDTGEFRGLLCMNCNQGLGRFQDSPTLLRAAADYLDRHAKPRLVCDNGEAA